MIKRFLVGALCVLAAGCDDDHGDDDDNGNGVACETAPCGGDIVGTWQIDEACPGVEIPPDENCPEAEAAFVDGPNISGTVTFDADLTYSLDIGVTGEVEITVPASCLPGPVGCEALGGFLGADTGAEATCTDAAEGGCECSMLINDTEDVRGTYTLSGTTLTTVAEDDDDPETDEVSESEYCAQGGELMVILEDEGSTVTVRAHAL